MAQIKNGGRGGEAAGARRPLLVVDGDNFAYRSYQALPKTIRRSGGRGGGAILGFANYLLRFYETERPRAVLFDAEAVTSIDVSGIAALREVRDTLAAQGIFFAIARARGTFLRMLVRSGMAREMEDKLLFGSVRAGIRAYRVWRNRSRVEQRAEQG